MFRWVLPRLVAMGLYTSGCGSEVGASSGPRDPLVRPDSEPAVPKLRVSPTALDLEADEVGCAVVDSVTLAKTALLDPEGCNSGLRREGAALQLLFVGDGPDSSISPYTYYVSTFQSYVEDPDDLRMSVVAGDYPSGCGEAGAPSCYFEASVATGGQLWSICEPGWGAELGASLGELHSTKSSWTLAEEPVPGTVEVTVDGVSEHGFVVDGAELTFDDDAVPAPGAEIFVTYVPTPDC